MTDAERLEEMELTHFPTPSGVACDECGGTWTCGTALLVAEVERLRGVEALTFQLVQEMGHNPTLPPMATLTWLDLLAALAEPEAKP